MKRFFALSRTTHGFLDLATPGAVALLWLGKLPPLNITLISLFTAFSAYTAVYALNDLIGRSGDREKFKQGRIKDGYSVEASELRYPLAQDAISFREALGWFAFWFFASLIGSYFLNPKIILILIVAAVLEVLYCKLLKVTYWRTLVSGVVKSCGPIAAVFAVDPSPSIKPLLLIFSWVFFWEIGGQNVPADWNDTEEDERVGARTIPLLLGFKRAGQIVLVALSLAVMISLFLPTISPADLGLPYWIATVLAGFFLLLRPASKLYQEREGRLAARLFDRASYYPLTMLAIISLLFFVS